MIRSTYSEEVCKQFVSGKKRHTYEVSKDDDDLIVLILEQVARRAFEFGVRKFNIEVVPPTTIENGSVTLVIE